MIAKWGHNALSLKISRCRERSVKLVTMHLKLLIVLYLVLLGTGAIADGDKVTYQKLLLQWVSESLAAGCAVLREDAIL